MQSAPLHPREKERLSTLLNYEILDTEEETAFDELTELASDICGTDIALVSFIDSDRQWFKSKKGLAASETSREIAFCSHAILQKDIFEIPNAKEDPRFNDNPLVSGEPNIRFYAGAPLCVDDEMPLGTLCVIDSKPKELSDSQRKALSILAKQVVSQLKVRIQYRRLERITYERDKIFALIAHDLRSPFSGILWFSKHLRDKASETQPAKISSMSETIYEASTRVYSLLDQLLKWSQIQLGADDCNRESQLLMPVIQDNIELYWYSLELKHIRLQIDVPRDLIATFDLTLTGAIIRNLTSNAIKFTPEGGMIKISTKLEKKQVLVIVSNTGTPFPADKKDSLFCLPTLSEPGTQGEIGHGVGLCFCGEFASRQGGKIWLDDSYEHGTSIVFSLPIM